MAALIDYLKPDDLKITPDMEDVAECLGFDFALQLIDEFGGQRLYVPRITSYRNVVIRYLTANRVKELMKLSAELGCSEKTVKRRLSELE